jgi:hypothetical protein
LGSGSCRPRLRRRVSRRAWGGQFCSSAPGSWSPGS